jgi:PBP1b-binding outer membrane lipoprotein LpoB
VKHNRLSYILAAALLLAGCSTFEGVITAVTSSKTTPVEVNTVAAATSLAIAADKVALPFMRTAACDKTCRHIVGDDSAAVRHALDNAIDAETAGDSAKEKLAFAAFNAAYPALVSYLATKGVTP